MRARILRTFRALVAGQGIHLAGQWLTAPVFVGAFGLEGYGQWIVISAMASSLSVADFGAQTFLLNELTMAAGRKDRAAYQRLLCTGVFLLGGFLVVGTVVAGWVGWYFGASRGGAFEPRHHVGLAVWLLSLQVLVSVVAGYVFGLYRVGAMADRGVYWSNLQRALVLVLSLGLALVGASFWVIAAGQLLAVVVTVVCGGRAVGKALPDLVGWSPRFHRWEAGRIVSQGAMFGLFSVNQFLVFQAPLLLIERWAGSAGVAAFSLGRTIFSMVRQATSLVVVAGAPELTRMAGTGEKRRLAELFGTMEGLVGGVAVVGHVLAFFLAELILRLWVGGEAGYSHRLYLALMTASLLLTMKDTKLYLQHATNNHGRTAVVTCVVYLVQLGGCAVAGAGLGVVGLVVVWAMAEVVQVLVIHRFNHVLLGGMDAMLNRRLVVLLGLALGSVAVLYLRSEPAYGIGAGWATVCDGVFIGVLGLLSVRWLGLGMVFGRLGLRRSTV